MKFLLSTMLLFMIFWAVCLVGYVRNAYLLLVYVINSASLALSDITIEMSLRAVGLIVIPFGVVMGFF